MINQYEIAYSKISKKGMTSGANTPVPDKSVFVEFFLKRLKENESKYLSAEHYISNSVTQLQITAK